MWSFITAVTLYLNVMACTTLLGVSIQHDMRDERGLRPMPSTKVTGSPVLARTLKCRKLHCIQVRLGATFTGSRSAQQAHPQIKETIVSGNIVVRIETSPSSRELWRRFIVQSHRCFRRQTTSPGEELCSFRYESRRKEDGMLNIVAGLRS